MKNPKGGIPTDPVCVIHLLFPSGYSKIKILCIFSVPRYLYFIQNKINIMNHCKYFFKKSISYYYKDKEAPPWTQVKISHAYNLIQRQQKKIQLWFTCNTFNYPTDGPLTTVKAATFPFTVVTLIGLKSTVRLGVKQPWAGITEQKQVHAVRQQSKSSPPWLLNSLDITVSHHLLQSVQEKSACAQSSRLP